VCEDGIKLAIRLRRRGDMLDNNEVIIINLHTRSQVHLETPFLDVRVISPDFKHIVAQTTNDRSHTEIKYIGLAGSEIGKG